MPPTRKDGAPADALQCASCDKIFASKKQLTVHQYLQHAAKLECKDCGKPFKTDELLKKHMLTHESGSSGSGAGKTSRTCTVCNEVFPLMRDLVEHHHQMHVLQKAFRCSVCNKQFSWHANLEKHMSMHQTIHHTCVKCGRGFWDADSLHDHLRTFHQDREITGNKPYACEVCGRAFEFDFTYKAHLTSHAGYVPSPTPSSNKKTPPTRPKGQKKHTPRAPSRITASDGRHEIVVEFLQPSAAKTTTAAAAAAASPAASEQQTSPNKAPTRKRKYEKYTPAIGNLVMTDELPFACDVCGQRFRWEISLKIHSQQHEDDEIEMGVRDHRRQQQQQHKDTPSAKHPSQAQNSHKPVAGRDSRIVARHASDDEVDFDGDEEEEEEVEEIAASNDDDAAAITKAAKSASAVNKAAAKSPLRHSAPGQFVESPDKLRDTKVSNVVPPATVILVAPQFSAITASDASSTTEGAVSAGRSSSVTVAHPTDVEEPSLAPVVLAHLQWQRVLGQTRRALVCKLCPYVASTPALLRRHALGHLASYFMHQCTRCGEGFPVQRELVLHALMHEAEPSTPSPHLRCSDCGRKFSSKAVLRRHSARHVRKFKVAKCTTCSRKFIKPHLLAAHECMHSTDTRWHCPSGQQQLDSESASEQH